MANHKRRRPKHQRAGCLMCKPWKDERGKNGKAQAQKRKPGRRGLRKEDDWSDEPFVLKSTARPTPN